MTSEIDRRLGARIRALRSGLELTLDALADRADVSRGMLSRVERGESSPTAQLLSKICGGLGVTLSTLFAGTESEASPLLRRADQPVWRDPESGYIRRVVSPPGNASAVDIVEIEFPSHARVAFDRQTLPGSGQHVWVMDGTLDIALEEESPVRLERGDCLAMRFGRPIVFRNPTPRTTRYAVVVSHGAARP